MTVPAARHPDWLSAGLIGTWELLSRRDRTASGELRVEPSLGENPRAMLYYDRTGHFAAQFMSRDRSNASADGPVGASNNTRARDGYDAYFGTYTVDEAKGSVTQVLVGALSNENVGQAVTRDMMVEGDTLTIGLETTSAQGVAVTRTLIWRRVG